MSSIHFHNLGASQILSTSFLLRQKHLIKKKQLCGLGKGDGDLNKQPETSVPIQQAIAWKLRISVCSGRFRVRNRVEEVTSKPTPAKSIS